MKINVALCNIRGSEKRTVLVHVPTPPRALAVKNGCFCKAPLTAPEQKELNKKITALHKTLTDMGLNVKFTNTVGALGVRVNGKQMREIEKLELVEKIDPDFNAKK